MARTVKITRVALEAREEIVRRQRSEIETLRIECQRLIDCNARLSALLTEAAARFDRTPDGEWRRAVRAELGDENA